jgi:hypothetical protein
MKAKHSASKVDGMLYRKGGRIVLVGVLVIVLPPLLALVGLGGGELLGCKGGGSSGPSYGCFGMSWIADVGLLAFMGSFFLVPIGVLILICGLIVRWLESRRAARGR